MAPDSSTLAWQIPWTEEPGRLQSMGSLSDFTFTFHFHAVEKEMATHSSVLAWRIPRNRGAWWAAVYGVAEGAWWAAVYGVAESRTRLKRLSSSSRQIKGGVSFALFSIISRVAQDLGNRSRQQCCPEVAPLTSRQSDGVGSGASAWQQHELGPDPPTVAAPEH